MPPWAQCVLVSLGSAARVTTVTAIPASARRRATVPPATPQPIISTSVSISSLTLCPSWHPYSDVIRRRCHRPPCRHPLYKSCSHHWPGTASTVLLPLEPHSA